MFQEVPQGESIFMKVILLEPIYVLSWTSLYLTNMKHGQSILHDWSDDKCITLLKNCYKALPCDGKIIIVEKILPFLPDISSIVNVVTQMDALMMTQNPGGKERTEEEFLALAKGAGFAGIKKECFARVFWVMEFYK